MTVRLLHTADWHLGHALHDVDRAPEHRRFLSWLADCCEAERVHALLISGDIFDVSNPPATALETWAKFLVDLWRRMPGVEVVVIGGNHDSPHRLEMTEPFHAALGRLHVLGAIPRVGGAVDLDRVVVRVQGEGESALVVAIPFLRPADLRATEVTSEPTAPVRRLLDEVLAGARARRTGNEALVAMGHLFVAGGTSGASERMLIGGIGAVPHDIYPPDVVYAALGHLHRAQMIGSRIRYSGPPIPLAFDEAASSQEVVVVTISAGTLAQTREVPVPRSRELLRVPTDGFRAVSEVLAALAALPERGELSEDERPLLEVRALLEQPEPSLRQQLDATLAGKAARLVRIQVEYTGTGSGLADAGSVKGLADLDPVEVFRRRWARQFPGEPPDHVLAAYAEVLEEARGLENAS
jgi:exonuclease SbcD